MALVMVKKERSCIINGYDDDVVPDEEVQKIKENIARIVAESITREITA